MKEADHLVRQPFGQIPTFECGDVAMFESGAIVPTSLKSYAGLLPHNGDDARARAISWMFAAVSTIEPVILHRETAMFTEREKPWFAERLVVLDRSIRDRLRSLSTYLGDSEWFEAGFTAGDLMMVQVLRRLGSSGLLNELPIFQPMLLVLRNDLHFKGHLLRSWRFMRTLRPARKRANP